MTTNEVPSRRRPVLGVVVLVGVLLLAAVVRLRLADVPLERDEGEYAYAAQLILDGIPPYALAYNMKFPGTYYAYALVLALFGQTAWAVHVGLLVVNAATTVVLYFLARRLMDDFAAAAAAAVFAILALDRGVMGTFAHATHFVLLPALGGLLVLLRAQASRRLATFAAAGALLGVAVLMKQQAAVFLVLAFGLAVRELARGAAPDMRESLRQLGCLTLGAALPFGVMIGAFAAQGVLGRFWFWTFRYAQTYVSQVAIPDAPGVFAQAWAMVTVASLPVWILGGVGLAALWLVRHPPRTRVFLTGLAVAGLAGISPGFYFRPHYFVLLLPAVALLSAVALTSLAMIARLVLPQSAARGVAALAGIAIIGWYVIGDRRYLFTSTPAQLHRALYTGSPFMLAPEIARYLREHTAADDRIAVLGSEPEIYFYADRRSASGYIYMYGLMEPQPYAGRMQDEMMAEIESARPAYVVEIRAQASWLTRPTSDRRVLAWLRRYLDACYTPVGVADAAADGTSDIRWDRQAYGWEPRSETRVYTYRRTGAVPCRAAP